jgi:hypothetical protein
VDVEVTLVADEPPDPDDKVSEVWSVPPVRLTMFVHTGLVVFSLSLSYGVWPPRAPCGRL